MIRLTETADVSKPLSNVPRNLILETRGLTRHFGKMTAVDTLNLSVEQGEIFGLLGPNGAGKSTVIKMLTTLLPVSAGSATLAGLDVTHQSTTVRRVIGYVPQALSADGTLTGYENLLIFAKLYEIPAKRRQRCIQEALSFMGLQDVAHRLVRNYSGGMIRKLEIAQSIMHQPQILFLDEPTVGLDPIARTQVWTLVQQLCVEWLKFLSHLNPLTYEVDALRDAMLLHSSTIYGFGLDCIILLLTLIGLTLICGKLYPRVAI